GRCHAAHPDLLLYADEPREALGEGLLGHAPKRPSRRILLDRSGLAARRSERAGVRAARSAEAGAHRGGPALIRYVLRRLGGMVPTLFLIATAVFVLARLAPGGPFDADRQVPIENQAAMAAKYHLDDPIWRQYASWLWALVRHGDLGPC